MLLKSFARKAERIFVLQRITQPRGLHAQPRIVLAPLHLDSRSASLQHLTLIIASATSVLSFHRLDVSARDCSSRSHTQRSYTRLNGQTQFAKVLSLTTGS